MLFNSFIYLFLFLPVTLIVFFAVGRRAPRYAVGWLVFASLFYYSWWNPAYLWIIIASILFNYLVGVILCQKLKLNKVVLVFGVVANLIFLGYFKYTSFLIENLNSLFANDFHVKNIVLPLAISFFTFQQIAYLVDSWKGKTRGYYFLDYCLFVTFFPQLIAGPIVHHKEMMPQFLKSSVFRPDYGNISKGLTIFLIGLYKKVILADTAGQYADKYFITTLSEKGGGASFLDAWVAAFSYTFQLYFDFSGYSDMAIGAALMFGILLPINFYSPYKATNMIEFWRRWHITLSQFLRDYIYIPLGGNRKGIGRRHVNLMITMLLGGCWHGTGWTFIIWGGLHGVFLVINHGWNSLTKNIYFHLNSKLTRSVSWFATFLAIVVAWVFFRAPTIDSSLLMMQAMAGLNGVELSFSDGASEGKPLAFLLCCLMIVKLLPNSISLILPSRVPTGINESKTGLLEVLAWRPSIKWALFCIVITVVSLRAMITGGYHEFIYRFF